MAILAETKYHNTEGDIESVGVSVESLNGPITSEVALWRGKARALITARMTGGFEPLRAVREFGDMVQLVDERVTEGEPPSAIKKIDYLFEVKK